MPYLHYQKIFEKDIMSGGVMQSVMGTVFARAYFKNLKVAITGDSLAEQNWGSVDSQSTELRTTGYLTTTNALLAKPYDMPYACNFGYSGQRVAYFLSQFSANCGAYITANDVDHLYITYPSNDIEDQTRTAQAVIDDYESLIDLAVATGVKHIFCNGAQPRGDWESETAGDLTHNVEKLHDVHNGIRALCENYSNVHFVDFFNLMVDPAITEPTSGLTYYPLDEGFINSDGVHLAPYGTYTIQTVIKGILENIGEWAEPKELISTDNAFNLNPDMAGTGGNISTGASGVAADDTRIQRGSGSTMTIVGSKDIQYIFGISQVTQKLEVTNNSASAEDCYFYVEYPEPDVDLEIGEGIQTTSYVKITEATNINTIYLYNRVTIGGVNYIARDMNTVSTQKVPDTSQTGNVDMVLRNEALPVPSAGTTTRCQQLIRIGSIADAGTETATVHVGRSIMEVV
tara:strand:+ start:521 stop:1894 length:1374 start_codon:yes stop_codon:yes gene_type:complete